MFWTVPPRRTRISGPYTPYLWPKNIMSHSRRSYVFERKLCADFTLRGPAFLLDSLAFLALPTKITSASLFLVGQRQMSHQLVELGESDARTLRFELCLL